MVYLIDSGAKTMYLYIPAQNTAIRMDFSRAPEAATQSLDLQGYSPVAVGTETLDGKVCLVIEYTVQGVKTKSWIWKEKGFPIRMETATPQGMMVMDFRNIEFVDIPDTMFELPAGVPIMQLPG